MQSYSISTVKELIDYIVCKMKLPIVNNLNEIMDDTSLFGSPLLLDTNDLVCLLLILEDEYDIEISLSSLKEVNFSTPGGILHILQSAANNHRY